MCRTTGNNTCDAMAKLHLCGNIIPQIWHKTIVSEKTGKADLIAINILADIAYWYRPAEERDELTGETVGYHPKFAADILQRSYDDLAEHFGISKGQAKCAVIRLEQLGVVRRVFRKISVGGISIPNVLFLALNVDRLRELTYPDGDTTGGENAEMSNQLDKDVSENRHTSVENAPTPPSKNHQTNTENTTKISTAISPEITHSTPWQMERVSLCPQRIFKIIWTPVTSYPQTGQASLRSCGKLSKLLPNGTFDRSMVSPSPRMSWNTAAWQRCH